MSVRGGVDLDDSFFVNEVMGDAFDNVDGTR
jgi:hypothetical protein